MAGMNNFNFGAFPTAPTGNLFEAQARAMQSQQQMAGLARGLQGMPFGGGYSNLPPNVAPWMLSAMGIDACDNPYKKLCDLEKKVKDLEEKVKALEARPPATEVYAPYRP